MRRLLIYSLCYFFILSFSLSAHAGERHHETSGGFSYEIPDGWVVEDFGGLKFKTVFTTPDNNFSPNMVLIDEKYEGNLTDYRTASIPYMKKVIKGFKILSDGQGKTDQGREYRTLRYRHQTDIGDIIQTAYFMEIGPGQKLVVTCTPPPAKEARYKPACEKMVKSIRVE